MNENGRKLLQGVGQVPLVAPKQEVKLQHIQQDGPTAAPIVVNGLLPASGGIQALVSFGGLTKLEALAGQIAGHISGVAMAAGKHDAEMVALTAADVAQAVLDECKRRQSPEPTQA